MTPGGHPRRGSQHVDRPAGPFAATVRDTAAMDRTTNPFDGFEVVLNSDDDEFDVPELPPVRLPSAPELLDATAGSATVRRLTDLMAWVGAGRPLDERGELSVEDAGQAADAVGLVAGQTEFSMLVGLARASGLVRTLKGRLVPVKGRARLLGRPVELWEHLFTSFAEMGERAGDDRYHPLWHFWSPIFDIVKLSLYTGGGDSVPVEMLVEITLDAPVGMLGFRPYSGAPPEFQRGWHAHLVDALTALVALGAIRVEPIGDPATAEKVREMSGRADPDLTLAALTPIGLWATNRWLVEQGVAAPALGDLRAAGLGELFERLTVASPEIMDAELGLWIERRGAGQAADEAARFLQATDEPGERTFAVSILGLTGADGLAAAQRVRAAGGIPGSVATGLLLAVDEVEATESTLAESMLGAIDQLCALADAGFVEDGFEGHPVPDQLRMVDECARSGHPRAVDTLDAIADAPVERKVAKAARRARLRLRR